MVSLDKAGRIVSAELEAHHRLCLEVESLQTELKSLKDGSWKKFQRLDPEEKKIKDVMMMASAEPSTKIRLCACGCGAKRRCSGQQESLPPLVGAGQGLFEAPPGANPVAQREYHDKLAQPRKPKEADESVNSRRSSKQMVDLSYLEQLAVPREKAREQSMHRKAGPVPKLPDLRSLQAKVLAADEGALKPQKAAPFISCPAKPTHSQSAPQLHMGQKRERGALLPAIMPRPQRRLTASRAHDMEELPGLGRLREHHCMNAGRIPMSGVSSSNSGSDSPGFARRAPKKLMRSMDAQQLYIDRYLAAPPKPKTKQEILTMKLEALRNARLAREGSHVSGSRERDGASNDLQVLKEEEPLMPAVNW